MMLHVSRAVTIFTFLLFLILLLGSTAMAEENTLTTPAVIMSPTPTPAQAVDYVLPYPGLLPDNPLYPLKAFRDKTISLFISDPMRKAEFDLLQSDKRVNASLYLYNEGKERVSLVSQTLSKAGNYYEEGIAQLNQAKMQGANITEESKIFMRAGMKYQEVFREMEQKAVSNVKMDIQGNAQRIAGFEKTLTKMAGQ